MNHLDWIDRNGAPITGRAPIQVRVHAPAGVHPDRQLVRGYLNTFLAEVRLSLGRHFRKTYTFANGSKLVAQSIFDQVSADLYLLGAKPEKPPFYGGILVQLEHVTDEAYWDDMIYGGPYIHPTTDLTAPDGIRDLIPEMASLGTGLGRPAVPGPRGDVEPTDENPTPPATDWLIIQIAPDKVIDDNAITTGAVKIFRICEPEFGPVVAYNTEADGYLVSANWSETVPLSEFYICGQRITGVPAITGVAGSSDVDTRTLRLYAFALSLPSFEEAADAAGIFIMAEGDNLWAINTLASDVAWTLLATTGASDRNYYGTTFTETTDPGSGAVTITCSGSNSFGVCSSFVVTITPQPSSPPTIAGTINAMAKGGTSPFVPQSMVFSTTQTVQSNRWESHQIFNAGDWGWALSYTPNANVTQSYEYTADDAGPQVDEFLGGTLPYTAPLHIEIDSEDNITCERAGAFDPLAPDFENYTRARTASALISGGPIPGYTNMSMSWSSNYPGLVESGNNGNSDPPDYYEHNTTHGIGPVVDQHDLALDHHDNRIAIRYLDSVAGSWVEGTGIVNVAMGEVSYAKVSVLLRDATVLAEHNLRSAFGDTLLWDEAQAWDRPTFNGSSGNFLHYDSGIDTFYPREHEGLFIQPVDTSCFATFDGFYLNGPDPMLSAPYSGANSAKLRSAANADLLLIPTAGDYDALYAQGEPIVNGTVLSTDVLVMTFPTNEYPDLWLNANWEWLPPRTREVSNVLFRDLRSGGFIYQILMGGMLASNFKMKPLLDLAIGNDLGQTPLVALINEWAKLGESDPEYERLLIRPESIKKVALL